MLNESPTVIMMKPMLREGLGVLHANAKPKHRLEVHTEALRPDLEGQLRHFHHAMPDLEGQLRRIHHAAPKVNCATSTMQCPIVKWIRMTMPRDTRTAGFG